MRLDVRLVVATSLLAAALLAGTARADGDADDFRANCFNCHTIGGGPLAGPDLKGVTDRIGKPDGPASRAWLVDFIVRPREVLASGDPYALRLKAAARGQEMQPVSGMTPKRAEQLLALIETESRKEKSVFAGSSAMDLPTEPRALAALVARGKDLFVGRAALAGGGASCLSCHQAGDAAPLGGGRLGPDLLAVVGRLGGVKPIQAWLVAPPTPTMKPQYGAAGRPLDPERDILPLVAFLKDVESRGSAPDRAAEQVTFVLLGVGLAGALLVGMDFAWRRRFRGVRARLVRGRA